MKGRDRCPQSNEPIKSDIAMQEKDNELQSRWEERERMLYSVVRSIDSFTSASSTPKEGGSRGSQMSRRKGTRPCSKNIIYSGTNASSGLWENEIESRHPQATSRREG